jgi:AbiV family abortive infection protein
MVTAQFLLEGSVYALEQCGLLLRDATALYKGGSYASSIAIAALAREGLDRAIVLRDLRDRVLSGWRLSLPEIKEEFSDHEEEGLVHMATDPCTDRDSPPDDVLRTSHADARGSQGNWQADMFAEQAKKEQAERARKECRALRIGCLYVRPDSVWSHWRRPKEHTREEARRFLVDALGDYARERDRIETGLCHPRHAEYVSAVRGWAGRPELPAPAWLCW